MPSLTQILQAIHSPEVGTTLQLTLRLLISSNLLL